MAYFDAVASSWFKTLPDGRKLFYPHGAFGRGYVVPTEQDCKRLQHQIKVYLIVAVVLMVGASFVPDYLGMLVVGVPLVGFFYMVWLPSRVRGLQPSDVRMTLRDSYTNEAVALSATGLWSMEIISLLFVALGVAMLALDPVDWLGAIGLIAVFGFGASVFTWMLVLRHRASHGQQPG